MRRVVCRSWRAGGAAGCLGVDHDALCVALPLLAFRYTGNPQPAPTPPERPHSVNARAPKGTADMLPDVARAWEHLQRTAQELFARYGYEPVYTPLFEHTEVFTRGIGEATDIV